MPLPSQQFLEVEQLREGTMITKDHAVRGIMIVSSLNFALKSREEQEAIIYQFQSFLNTLDFSCQILIQSRKMNITGYLDKLREIEEEQKKELLKIQTRDYRQFVEKLVFGSTIMSKQFYIIVPFYLSEQEGTSIGGTLLKIKTIPTLTEELFQRCKNQLYQRMEFMALGLRRFGISAAPLQSEEIAELLWSLYHPAESQIGYYPEIPLELIK